MFCFNKINETFSLQFLKKRQKLKYAIVCLTLTNCLDDILTGKGQHFNWKWSDGANLLGSKFVSDFNKIRKLSGAKIARMGPRALSV